MNRTWVPIFLLIFSSNTVLPRTASSAHTLMGLWKAQHWFGPVSRGTLIIQKTGAAYTADMMGRSVQVI